MASETTGATGVAGRYASALYELADEGKVLDAVAQDLKDLQAMIDESADLHRMIRSPVIARDDQVKAMDVLAEKAGMNDLTRRFVGVVAANRRLFALPAIIKAFLAVMAERRGEVTANVVSAKKLTEKQMEALSSALRKVVGGDVAVDARVDPGLLGGLVVKIGSRMVDSSLRTKLLQLQLAMKGVG